MPGLLESEIRPRLRISPESVALLLAAVWLVVAPTAGLSPDGMEMLAVSRCLRTGACETANVGYWPPVWPASVALLSHMTDAEGAGRALNIVCGAAVIPFLWRAINRFREPSADPARASLPALAASVLWAGLPSVVDHIVVLDARPMGMLVTSFLLWAAVEAFYGQRSWAWAYAGAAIAPLVRPEGVAMAPLVALTHAMLLATARPGGWQDFVWVRPRGQGAGESAAKPSDSPVAAQAVPQRLPGLGMLLLSALPHVAWNAAMPGGRSGVEAFFGPWMTTWPLDDLLALMGPASFRTSYGLFVAAQVERGNLAPPRDFGGLLVAIMRQLADAPIATASVGGTALALALLGSVVVRLRNGGPGRVGTLAGVLLWAAISAAPMSGGQATRAANLLFLLPGGLLLLASIVPAAPRRRRGSSPAALWATVGVVCLVLVDAYRGPFREPAPRFLIGTPPARLAARILAHAAPRLPMSIYAGFEGRGIVRRAEQHPLPLPNGWEPFAPEPGTYGLLVDGGLLEAGVALAVFEAPDTHLCWVVEGDGLVHLEAPVDARAPEPGWVALVRFGTPCEDDAYVW